MAPGVVETEPRPEFPLRNSDFCLTGLLATLVWPLKGAKWDQVVPLPHQRSCLEAATSTRSTRKGASSVPARLREALAQLGEKSEQLVVVPNEHALEVHPLGEWQRIEEKLNAQPMFTPEVRQLSCLYMSRASDATRQRRPVPPPPDTRKEAGLEKEVTLVGGGRRMFEVWTVRASRNTSARTAISCRRSSTSCPGTESSGSRSCPRGRGRVSPAAAKRGLGDRRDGGDGRTRGGVAGDEWQRRGGLGLDADPEGPWAAGRPAAGRASAGGPDRFTPASPTRLGRRRRGHRRGAGDPVRSGYLLVAAGRLRSRLLLSARGRAT